VTTTNPQGKRGWKTFPHLLRGGMEFWCAMRKKGYREQRGFREKRRGKKGGLYELRPAAGPT